MGLGRASAPQSFPPLFGPYNRTELLAMLVKLGPLPAPALKRAVSRETVQSVRRDVSNKARLVVSSMAKLRGQNTVVVGLNRNVPFRTELGNLLQTMSQHHTARHIESDFGPHYLDAFQGASHPDVDIEAFFGTHIRTRLLVALHVLGGEESKGKLVRMVLDHFAGQVRVAISACLEEGILIRSGKRVRFNENMPWMPQLRALLDALSICMPEVSGYALYIRDLRGKDESDTQCANGRRYRLFGSRLNQAILAYLGAYGPSSITSICAASGAVTTHAIKPLLKAGIVTTVHRRKGTLRDIYSLNAAYPVYRELKAILRTGAILDEALPFRCIS